MKRQARGGEVKGCLEEVLGVPAPGIALSRDMRLTQTAHRMKSHQNFFHNDEGLYIVKYALMLGELQRTLNSQTNQVRFCLH